MRRTVLAVLPLAFAASLAGEPVLADPSPSASVVYLRTNCTGVTDCFTSVSALVSWIASRGQPGMTPPLTVEIGPGTFPSLKCGITLPGGGPPPYQRVTFRGSGRERTIFTGSCAVCAGIEVFHKDCGDLEFIDLGAHGNPFGAVWISTAGDSTWTNVDLRGARLGWYEYTNNFPCGDHELSRHVWFNSRITADAPDSFGGVAYQANCGASEFYSTELALNPTNATSGAYADGFAVLEVGGPIEERRGEVEAITSTFRLIGQSMPLGVVPQNGISGVRVFNGSSFEMHGGIINVGVNPAHPSPINGLRVDPGGVANTAESAFVVTGGLGAMHGQTRRVQGASAQSPLVHRQSVEPPLVNPTPGTTTLASTIGSDVYVETDCNSAGTCNGSGEETHVMIYNDVGCPGSKWFNATKGVCRP
jgi:hypothetical protein